jgi:signal transduction histidine kinase
MQLIQEQEKERARIVRELNSDLSQEIMALSIAVTKLKSDLRHGDASADAEIDRVHERMVGLADHVRSLSHSLQPATEPR